MTKYYQLFENNQNGDCFRTCIACLLDCDEVTDVPNFMENGADKLVESFEKWLDENKLVYTEFTIESFEKHWEFLQNCYCVVVGKSKNHNDTLHAIIGEIKDQEGGGRELMEYHNPTRSRQEHPMLETYEYIGILSRKL